MMPNSNHPNSNSVRAPWSSLQFLRSSVAHPGWTYSFCQNACFSTEKGCLSGHSHVRMYWRAADRVPIIGLHGQSLETYELQYKSESWRSTAACATHDEESWSSGLCQVPVAAGRKIFESGWGWITVCIRKCAAAKVDLGGSEITFEALLGQNCY